MKEASRRMATCGMLTALSVVLMLLGSVLGVLVYACPMFAALAIQYVRGEYGPRYALAMFAATGLVALMLVPDLEMSAVYLGIVGWYPVLKPVLDKCSRVVQWLCKLLVFNLALVLVYRVLLGVMGADRLGLGMGLELLVSLVMGNVLFVLYDRMLHKLTAQRLKTLIGRFFPH